MPEAGMLMRWRLAGSAQPSEEDAKAADLARATGLPPLVARLLLHRGVADAQTAQSFLSPKLTDLHDPALLPGVEQAALRLERAVAEGQPIVIYGDYDVDGISASAILWHMLTLAGGKVTTYVPHRIEEGYGINCEAIARLASGQINGNAEQGTADREQGTSSNHSKPLIVSVDCGITAVEPAQVVRRAGVDLIITDHHEFDPAHLPEAHTLVHPRFPGLPSSSLPPYPFPDLCGAGVAFKLAWQFAKVHCQSERLPAEFRNLLLDLVSLAALGTIADVVPLRGENRILATFGLGQIKRTRFVGLNALIDASRLRDEKIDAYHVGFSLGPRLNACGRLGHAKEAVYLFTSASASEAQRLAEVLSKENERRRSTERAIFTEARDMVFAAGYDRPDCRAIVLGKEGWHPGVVGIVCSRLVDQFARPAVLLNLCNGEAQGSARSVDGVSIHTAFTHCAQHLTSFGGHAMAAGLRLPTGNIDAFRTALVAYVNAHLAPEDMVATLDIDAECELADLTIDLGTQLQKLAPFGRGNPGPVLCVRRVALAQAAQRIGRDGHHLRLMLRQNGRFAQAVWFGAGDLAEKLPAGAQIDVAFEPSVSTWQGQKRCEMHVQDVRLTPRV
jgi:single-stranded-DNA-specific exonuclease